MALGLRDKAYDLCRQYLSGSWKTINKDDMVFESVSGGLTNVLFLCSLPSTHTPLNGEPSQVLMRMYGQIHSTNEHDSSVTKITESVIFMMLSERNLGPKLYGIFPEGRLEEYISARALTCSELHDPIISAIIARKLANVHSLNVPINKEPTWLFNQMYEWLEKVRTLDVDQMYENDRLERSKQKSSAKKHQKQQKKIVKNPFNYEAAKFLVQFDYEHEIEWLKEFLKQCDSPVVFAHNDAQEGNILIPDYLSASKWSSNPESNENENNNKLSVKNKNKPKHLASTPHLRKSDLMSYKYTHHRRSSSPDDLYDSGLVNDNSNSDDDGLIADGFASEDDCDLNCDLDCGKEEDSPQKTKQHYLKQLDEKMVLIDFEYCSYNYRGFDLANHFCEWMYDYSHDKFPHYKFNPQNYPNENQLRHFINEYVKHYYQGENYIGPDEEKAVVEKILNEIRYYTLASHLLWTLWSINNAVTTQISFGYWEYGKCRLDSYLAHKNKMLALFKK